jgi:hypothetical protein
MATTKIDSIPKLTAKAQKVFNAYIRKRDSENGYFTCISCGKTLPIDKMNAGHFAPVKGGSALRFDEYNVNGECEWSNCFDEFHLIGYRKGIIDKYGEDILIYLEQNARLVKRWSRTELNELIEKYK